MPNRIIREDILTSEAVDQLDFPAEVFYRRLLNKVDDYGRYYANPKLLLANLYQLRANDIKCSQIEKWLAQTVAAKLVMVYQNDGKLYLEVAKFRQQLRTPSRFPEPSAKQMITNDNNCVADAQQMHTSSVFVSVSEGVSVSVSEGDICNCASDAPQLLAAGPQKIKKSKFAAKPESLEECVTFVTEKLQLLQSDGTWFWDHGMAAGWLVNGRRIASWKHLASNWKAQRYFPSLKDRK